MTIGWSAAARLAPGGDGSGGHDASSDASSTGRGVFVGDDLAGLVAAGIAPTLATRSGFRGATGDVLRSADAADRPVVVAGLGATPDLETVTRAAAVLARALRHCERVSVVLPALDAVPVGAVARAVAEGMALALYRFERHKRDPRPNLLEHVELVADDVAAVQAAIEIAEPVIAAVTLARDLGNETPERMTATRLADVAVSLAGERGLAVEVWDAERIVAERLGLLAAVNAGSRDPARLVRLDYAPARASESTPHLVLVGKGITFDSGGLSLKRPAGMYDMKGDMGGAAAVLGALSACVALDVGVRVTAIIAATDNLPGPTATKPGEVVAARDGTTVEILDTDAEGRLVLADALCLASELAPTAIIDVATLTGYAKVLGPHHTPLMSNDDSLRERVLAAATAAGEAVWPLPLPEQYVEALESPVADLRNIPDPDDGGTVAPGVFLRHFVGECPWAHLDIGETGFATKDDGERTKGLTGAMVRTLCELVRTWEPTGAA